MQNKQQKSNDKMSPNYCEFKSCVKQYRIKNATKNADKYQALPVNFRVTIARNAGLPKEKHETRLDKLTESEKKEMRKAVQRLKRLGEQAAYHLVGSILPDVD